MKLKLLSLFFLFAFLSSSAKDIDVNTAMTVAKNFYAQKAAGNRSMNSSDLNLTLVSLSESGVTNNATNQTSLNLYYVFNVNAADGFIIVSGDDIAIPVLGYSDHGAFNAENLPPAFQKWMEHYKEQILYAKANITASSDELKASWDELENAQSNTAARQAAFSGVTPLLSTKWNQEPYYNVDCPYDAANTVNQHVPTGCVATTMAQIMKYWGYPASGTGYHSYNHPTYGTLSANFGATTYNWGSMPDSLTASNADIATLMFQCGVSVEMNYGPDGSGAFVIASDNYVCAQTAYTTYFGYDPSSIQGLRRNDAADITTWKNLLKNELNNSRPIEYAGFGTGGGHTWVCDGYDGSDNFHMNWGWGGQGPDGYYSLDALDPPALGSGGGAGGFNSNEQAVIGIKPKVIVASANIKMNSVITIAPNPILYNSSFTVNADVTNGGTVDFNGIYSADLYTTDGTLVATLQSISTNGTPLHAGSHYSGGLTFNCFSGIAQPGTYLLELDYTPNGGSLLSAASNGYVNPVSVTITGPPANLQVFSAITPSPLTFVQGQPASVFADIKNTGASTFTGYYGACITDLYGNLIEIVGEYGEFDGLGGGQDYGSPLEFDDAAVSSPPGSYKLGIYYVENISDSAILIGNEFFPNPIDITVVAPSLSPDIYEPDNTQQTAYTLPLSWSADTADAKSTGSNLNTNTDVDFYKINLATGYSYVLVPRVEDVYNTDDGNTYTCDVLWSYSTGGSWSQTYDDVMAGYISITGPATITFQVAPYFSGNTGTYLLKVGMMRSIITGMNSLSSIHNELQVNPNPANHYIEVKLPVANASQRIRIINAIGQEAMSVTLSSSSNVQRVNTSQLPAGIYCIEAAEVTQRYSSRFIISR